MKQRMIKVLAIGFAVAGLSAGLATTALAATHNSSQAAASAAAHAAAARPASAASSSGVTEARLKAEIQALKQVVAEGRATTEQLAELHALEARLAYITAGN